MQMLINWYKFVLVNLLYGFDMGWYSTFTHDS